MPRVATRIKKTECKHKIDKIELFKKFFFVGIAVIFIVMLSHWIKMREELFYLKKDSDALHKEIDEKRAKIQELYTQIANVSKEKVILEENAKFKDGLIEYYKKKLKGKK